MKNFMVLWGYEFKKIIISRLTVVMLAIVAGLLFYLGLGWEASNNQLLNDLKGPLTEEKYQIVMKAYKQIQTNGTGSETDFVTIESLDKNYSTKDILETHHTVESILYESKNRQEVIQRAKNNIERCRGDANKVYFLRYNQKVLDAYQGRGELMLADTGGWRKALPFLSNTNPFNPSDILFGLLFICCLCPLFAREHETGILSLIHTTRNGKSKLFWAKIGSAGAFILVSLLLFFAIWVFAVSTRFTISDPFAPIQVIETYQKSPFNVSILGFLAVILLFKAAFFFLLFLIVSIAGLLFKNRFAALVTGLFFYTVFFLTLFVPVGLREIDYASLVFKQQNLLWNVGSLSMQPHQYFVDFSYVNIGGWPVETIAVPLSILLVLLFVLMLFCCRLYRRERKGCRKIERKQKTNQV